MRVDNVPLEQKSMVVVKPKTLATVATVSEAIAQLDAGNTARARQLLRQLAGSPLPSRGRRKRSLTPVLRKARHASPRAKRSKQSKK